MHFTFEHPLGQHDCAPDLYSAHGTATLASTAERCGFEAIAFTEHPAPPRVWVDKGGHVSFDPLVALSFCAAVTHSIKLLTHLLVLPYHAPLALAKTVATVDQLASGRLVLGVGSGYLQQEFEALGVDFETRSRRFDEALHTLQNVWQGPDFTYGGEDFAARAVLSAPGPLQLPHPPLWIGGTSRAARRRVARSGQGWMPLMMHPRVARSTHSASITTPGQLATAIADLKNLVEDAGRDSSLVDVQVYAPQSLINADEISTDEHLDFLGHLQEAGVTWFVVRPSAVGLSECCDSMADYGDRIVSRFR